MVLTPRHHVPFLLDEGVLAEVLVFRHPTNTTSSFTSIWNKKYLLLFTLFLTSFDLGGVLRRQIMMLQIFLSVYLLSNGRLLLLHIFSCSCNTVDRIRKYFLCFIFFSRRHKTDKKSSWKGTYFRKEIFKLFKTHLKPLC